MEVRELHRLDLPVPEARALQDELSGRATSGPPLDLGRVRFVAGADVSMMRGATHAYSAVVVLSFPELAVVEVRTARAPLDFPYVPGLLAFREIPAVAAALREVRTPVDALIFDAHGLAHPRRMGLATHLGLFLDVPSIGCAKTRLAGEFDEPGRERGSASELRIGDETVGRVLRTRSGVSPVFVSVGDRIDLASATELVLACAPKYRLPQTTREAHDTANQARREGEAEPG